ncbi:MAG: hypothetical protein DCC68_08255 [Planctomycetota bacterium]|nr:MAG: hypothetical protein DCC68_08255 [Planctomycetota bacterium]
MTLRKWIVAVHRDVGYFFTGVVVVYAISGISVNHADDWNSNFIVEQSDVRLDLPRNRAEIDVHTVAQALGPLGEADNLRSYAFPSAEKIKVYLKDGDIVAGLGDGYGVRETIRRRPVLHHFNMLHVNPETWWLLFSDIFAGALVLIALTGLFIARGRYGLTGRGKWLVGAGLIAPLAAMCLS